jgi:hypothetical protein
MINLMSSYLDHVCDENDTLYISLSKSKVKCNSKPRSH